MRHNARATASLTIQMRRAYNKDRKKMSEQDTDGNISKYERMLEDSIARNNAIVGDFKRKTNQRLEASLRRDKSEVILPLGSTTLVPTHPGERPDTSSAQVITHYRDADGMEFYTVAPAGSS